MSDKLYIRQPGRLTMKAIENPILATDDSVFIYCGESQLGAIYHVPVGRWNILGPFDTRLDFLRHLGGAFPELAEG